MGKRGERKEQAKQGQILRSVSVTMLKRHRLKLITALLGIIAASYAVWGWLYVSEYEQKRSYERASAAYEYSDTSNPYIEGRCGTGPYLVLRECTLDDINAEQTEQREKADLQAQQDMSKWALILALLGFPSLIVGMGGLCALIWTFTKQRELLMEQQRAVLEVQNGAFWEIMEHGTPTLELEVLVKNTGKTHAKNISFEATVTWHPTENMIDDSTGETEIVGERITEAANGICRDKIPPEELGIVVSQHETRINTDPLINAAMKWGSGGPNLMGMSAHLTFSGRIKFDDVFGVEHEVPFHFECYTKDEGTPTRFGRQTSESWRLNHYEIEKRQQAKFGL